jgi:hypothetical protein
MIAPMRPLENRTKTGKHDQLRRVARRQLRVMFWKPSPAKPPLAIPAWQGKLLMVWVVLSATICLTLLFEYWP